ncbi:MAG: AAA family ATPase [Acetivibrio sp.]
MTGFPAGGRLLDACQHSHDCTDGGGRGDAVSGQHQDLLSYLAFYDYVSSHIVKGEKNYLIFDELQAVTHWEKAIESFRLDFDVDIYITGSNAYLLSSEFSTLLPGRYVEILLLPLSFAEFLTFYSFEQSVTMEELNFMVILKRCTVEKLILGHKNRQTCLLLA